VVAARHVDRLEDEEGRGEPDHPLGRSRRLVEIDNVRVQRIARINLDIHRSVQPFIWTGVAKALPIGYPAGLFHHETDHARFARRCDDGWQEQREQHLEDRFSHDCHLLLPS
jgi:hypothetical protein